jgi:predicted phage terminase large subunit-like protein
MNLSKLPKEQLTIEACLKAIKEKIKEDPFFLTELLYPRYQFKLFHRKWFEQALFDEEEICLGPRNFAKTTVRGIIWVIYQMIQNPNIQLGIVSDTGPQAIHFVSEVKMQIERNTLLTLLYPYLKPGNLWRDNEFTIVGSTTIQKGATVTAFGYGGATGYEFDAIMVDDIVDFDNSRTKYQRDKLEDWIGMSLRPMLKSDGILHWSGTRYHTDDQYGRLLRQNICTNQDTHKAILDNGESMWPELWPKEKLLDIKEKIGSIRFNAQYQNDIALMAEGKIFKREWFRYFRKNPHQRLEYLREDGSRIHIKELAIYQTCDLAISKKDSADYFVILTFGVDKEGNIYILHLNRGHYNWAEQKRVCRMEYLRWKEFGLRWMGIESVQYQAVLAQELNTFTEMSVRNLTPRGTDKVTRAMSMSAKYESGKAFHLEGMDNLRDFEDELTSFDEGEHDDMVDCVGYIPYCVQQQRAKVYVN